MKFVMIIIASLSVCLFIEPVFCDDVLTSDDISIDVFPKDPITVAVIEDKLKNSDGIICTYKILSPGVITKTNADGSTIRTTIYDADKITTQLYIKDYYDIYDSNRNMLKYNEFFNRINKSDVIVFVRYACLFDKTFSGLFRDNVVILVQRNPSLIIPPPRILDSLPDEERKWIPNQTKNIDKGESIRKESKEGGNLTTSNSTGADRTEYSNKYMEWRLSVKDDLDKGRSAIMGDRKILNYLAENAEEHKEFLVEKLRNDIFTVLILNNSPLANKHKSLLKDIGHIEAGQAAWMIILGAEGYENKYYQWRILQDDISITDKNKLAERESLLKYLEEHAIEKLVFLKRQLNQDAKVVVILENSDLYSKYKNRIDDNISNSELYKKYRDDISETIINVAKKKAWLDLLN
jgi:hypothetical protein